MIDHLLRRALAVALLALPFTSCAPRPANQVDTSTAGADTATPMTVDWSAVDSAIGRPGAVQASDVHRYGFPRSDMHVTIGGITLRPAFALGGWIAMKAVSDGAVAMGDLVLADSEMEGVISALEQGGVEVTAIHHHLLRESPRVYYMHVHAHGAPVGIAQTIHAAMALTNAPPPAAEPSSASVMTPFGIDTAQIVAALGYRGRINGGVYQVSVPRAEVVHDGTFTIPGSMGLGTGINFQPTSGGRAAITGDFVMVASEVNPVIAALRDHGIDVVALHNHMLTEEPRLFFMHFWADSDAVTLAQGLRAALDRMNVVPAASR